jgi:adenylate kinase
VQVDRTAWFEGGGFLKCEPHESPRGGPYRLVLLGPPGVGKGTQAPLLYRALGSCHLSTGDLFRSAHCRFGPSPALKSALEAMWRGELVPDELVVSMVRERAGCLRCRGGFLLDGFPRTLAQAVALDAMLEEQGVTLDAALSYELPLGEIISRLGGRRTCESCRAVYHLRANPPRERSVCDRCGGKLIRREDDRPASIRVRMRAYEESTRPLLDYYQARGKLLTIPARGTPSDILESSLNALRCTRVTVQDPADARSAVAHQRMGRLSRVS